MSKLWSGLSVFERWLWTICVCAITLSSVLFWSGDVLTLLASLVGVTALVFLAKGNWIGQVLIIIFALIYGVISFRIRYYGEMITYVCMSAPIAAVAMIEWIRHPYKRGKNEVAVASLTKLKIVIMLVLCAFVTFSFYHILKYFGNANLNLSTVSIGTSFCAAYLLLVRSPYYALVYAINDVVLIGLWILATIADLSKLPVVVCFVCFFANDMYGFTNWIKMKKKQSKS